MANFLITTASTLAQGTSTADTFYFNTARGISIQGADGNDVLTAGTANLTATNALLAGNAGNDTINLLSSFNTNQGSILGGAGNDTISASQFSAVDSLIQGGGGNDTVTIFTGTLNRGNLGLNAGDDSLILTASAVANSAVIALGGGADTLTAFNLSSVGSTVNGGGGADTIDINDGSFAGGQINGDVLADNTFFGNDTITVSANFIIGGTTINGGYGNDTISAFGGSVLTAFVNGNDGTDTITINGIDSAAQSAFIGGGAGNDTMNVGQVSGEVSFGTIMGGGGADTITYSATLGAVALNSAGTTGGFIQGGAGADSISFNGTETGGVATILYTDATESNIDAIDTVSSNAIQSAAQDVLVFNVLRVNTATSLEDDNGGVTNGGANEVYTGVGGIVTFTSTFSDNISDQVSALDANTEDGSVAVFSKGTESTTYLFMQGGSAGTADDLVVKVNEGSFSGSFLNVDLNGNSAISLDVVAF